LHLRDPRELGFFVMASPASLPRHRNVESAVIARMKEYAAKYGT
jgi:hypothetical protein